MAEPFRLVRGGVFVPQWGNADRADADKIRVHYRFLTLEEQQRHLIVEKDQVRYDDIGAVAQMIEKIDNLSIAYEDGKEIQVVTGEDLMRKHAGLDSLAVEVLSYVRSQSAVDKKK